MTLSLTIIISKLAKLKQDSQDGLQKAILLLPPYYVLRRRSGIRNANCDLVPTLLTVYAGLYHGAGGFG